MSLHVTLTEGYNKYGIPTHKWLNIILTHFKLVLFPLLVSIKVNYSQLSITQGKIRLRLLISQSKCVLVPEIQFEISVFGMIRNRNQLK